MGRHIKNNADWFPHYAAMRSDRRISILFKRFKAKGYGIWNYLLETLTGSEFFRIETTDLNLEIIAGDLEISVEELRDFLDYCKKIGLVEVDKNETFLWCPLLLIWLKPLIDERIKEREKKKKQKNVFPGENEVFSGENEIFPGENTHSTVEYSKEHSSSVDIRARGREETGELVDEEQPEMRNEADDEVVDEDMSERASMLADKVDSVVDALLSDSEWKELVFRRFKFLNYDKQMLHYFIQKWGDEVKMRNRGHADLADAKEHLKNWLIIQEEKFNENEYNNGKNNNGYRSGEDIFNGAKDTIARMSTEDKRHLSDIPVV